MVGYVPGKASWFSDWRNIRARDAHAWTEAYFPNSAGFSSTRRRERKWICRPRRLRELIDALDVAWYVNIVNFDTTAQRGFFTSGVQAFMATAGWAKANARWISRSRVRLALILVWRSHSRGWRNAGHRQTPATRRRSWPGITTASCCAASPNRGSNATPHDAA